MARCLKTQKKSHCERSELRLQFERTKKLSKNPKNGPFWRDFENLKLAVKQCYQKRSDLVRQKLVENAKIQMRHFE